MYVNRFARCEVSVTEDDLVAVERAFAVIIHAELRRHYLFCNGGVPEKTCWIQPGWEPTCLTMFLPVRPRWITDPRFARRCSLQDTLDDVLDGPHIPPGLVPFAQDWGGNYFCVDGDTGGVYFYAMDSGDDFEGGKRYLVGSLKTFIDNLVEEA